MSSNLSTIRSVEELWQMIAAPLDGRVTATRIDPLTGIIHGARLRSRIRQKEGKGRLLLELWRQDGVENDRFFPLLLLEADQTPDGLRIATLEIEGRPRDHRRLQTFLPDLAATIGVLRQRSLDGLPLLAHAKRTADVWALPSVPSVA